MRQKEVNWRVCWKKESVVLQHGGACFFFPLGLAAASHCVCNFVCKRMEEVEFVFGQNVVACGRLRA